MAGDRRATSGNHIAHRRVQKVFPADEFSAVAIAGTAGHRHRADPALPDRAGALREDRGHPAVARRARPTTWPGWCATTCPSPSRGWRWSRCSAASTRQPETGALYSFDVVGGRYEEQDYATTGSGGNEARAFLKASYRPDLDEDEALGLAVEALVAAAEEDTATGGPDVNGGSTPTSSP